MMGVYPVMPTANFGLASTMSGPPPSARMSEGAIHPITLAAIFRDRLMCADGPAGEPSFASEGLGTDRLVVRGFDGDVGFAYGANRRPNVHVGGYRETIDEPLQIRWELHAPAAASALDAQASEDHL